MAGNIRLTAALCLLCLFCTDASAFGKKKTRAKNAQELLDAQKAAAKSYYIRNTEADAVFVQKFSWDTDPNALRYEFIIEQQAADGSWQEKETIQTEKSEVEQSLAAGSYRYRVRKYNLLDLLESETDWQNVAIIKAYQPGVSEVTPGLIYLEEKNDGVYTVSGEELRPDSKYFLIPNEGKSETRIEGRVIEDDSRNRKIRVSFDIKQLDVSKYALYAEDASGLSALYAPVIVKFKKPVDLDISAGYSPLYIVADDTVNTYFGKSFWPISACARVTFIPLKRRIGYFGIAFAGSYFTMKNEQSTYTVKTDVITATADLVYQKYLYKRTIMLDVHAGAGMLWFPDMQFEFSHNVTSDKLNSRNPAFTGGLALQTYVLKRLYIEAACDFTYAYIPDMVMAYVQPSLSVG